MERGVGADGRTLTIASSDEGPRILWGDDVLAAIDRGLAVAAFTPKGQLIGQWAFSVDESLACSFRQRRTCFAARRRVRCCVLANAPRSADVLADGGWWATVEGTGAGDSRNRHESTRFDLAAPRGEWPRRGIHRYRTIARDPLRCARHALGLQAVDATVGDGDSNARAERHHAVRVCRASIPSLPPTGALEVDAGHDDWFGAGWHLGERGGRQRFRWSQRTVVAVMADGEARGVRMILRMRAANADGATIQASINGAALPSCGCRRARGPTASSYCRKPRCTIGDQRAVAECGHDVAFSRSSRGCPRARVRDAG